MKMLTTLGTALLFLTLGSLVPAFAQEEQAKPEQKQQQEHAQPQQQAKQPSQPKQEEQAKQPSQRKQEKQAKQPSQPKQEQQAKQPSQPKQEQQAKQPSQPKQQQQAKQPSQPKPQQQAKQQSQPKQQQPAQHTQQQQQAQQAAWQGHRSQNWQSDHRTWQQRGGYNGYRIPDNRYNGYFGSGHAFVIYSQPYMVIGGFPRFQYSGYWFTLVDPWPSSWAINWYQNDNVYVVYADGGYYMYNQSYPGVGIAISVSM